MSGQVARMDCAAETPELALSPDRRSAQRLMATLRIGKMVCNDVEELCLIRNISEGGAMLRVYAPRAVGDQVSIELKSNRTVTGEVVWKSADGASIGIRFDEPIDVNDVLRNECSRTGRRIRSPRIAAHSRARLRIGQDTHFTELCDLSQGGAKVAFWDPVELNEEVVLTIPGLRSLKGIVRWQAHEQTGISFNTPLPLGELIEWLNAGRARDA
jgi:hypothetical protein